MKLKQRRWHPLGWTIMFTWGQTFGLGIFTGGTLLAARCNGVDVMVGPVTLTIQPPAPKWIPDPDLHGR